MCLQKIVTISYMCHFDLHITNVIHFNRFSLYLPENILNLTRMSEAWVSLSLYYCTLTQCPAYFFHYFGFPLFLSLNLSKTDWHNLAYIGLQTLYQGTMFCIYWASLSYDLVIFWFSQDYHVFVLFSWSKARL